MRVAAFVFEGWRTAEKVLAKLEQQSRGERRWIDDVAVISRARSRRTRVTTTWAEDPDDRLASGFGALTGGLIGSMAGPAGALTGALAGGKMFGMVGSGMDMKFEEPELDEFASRLAEDTSALVLLADDETSADFRSAMEPYEATLIETELDDRELSALRELLNSRGVR